MDRYTSYTYTIILVLFLYHISTIFSKSLSDIFSGDSIAIFIKWDRLFSPRRFLRWVFIIFIWEKLRSTEAVPIGIGRHMLAKVFKFGSMLMSVSLVQAHVIEMPCLSVIFFLDSALTSSIQLWLHQTPVPSSHILHLQETQQSFSLHTDVAAPLQNLRHTVNTRKCPH